MKLVSCLLLVLLSLSLANAAFWIEYVYPSKPNCNPVEGFLFTRNICPFGGNSSGLSTVRTGEKLTSCQCSNNTGELIIMALVNWTVNSTGDFGGVWVESSRLWPGVCYNNPTGGECRITVVDTPGLCGHSWDQVVANGRPYTIAELQSQGPTWPQGDARSVIPPVLFLVVCVFFVSLWK